MLRQNGKRFYNEIYVTFKLAPDLKKNTVYLSSLCPLNEGHVSILTNYIFVAVFLGCTSTGRVGLCFLWFFVQELPKAQPAVVLVLKRLRRRGNGLKSHPTDWEKPGIEPATPGLQDIGLSPTPRRLLSIQLNASNIYQ